ncbi:hypothetical protein PG993_010373 [Apiospora rasikravindrae]|uniref:Uncharacterized protein n=1 Tax=Apiospora rasikravindrae TaxID=990691 RepID=A0ABR1SM23_9PEZI
MSTAIATRPVGLPLPKLKRLLSEYYNGEKKFWGSTKPSKVTLPEPMDRPGDSSGSSNNRDAPPNGGGRGDPDGGGGGGPPGDGGRNLPDGGGGGPPDDDGPGATPMSVDVRPRISNKRSGNVRWICVSQGPYAEFSD